VVVTTFSQTVVSLSVGAVIGTVVGHFSSLRLQRRDHQKAAAIERRRALARFLGRLTIVVARLDEMPDYVPSILDRALAALVEKSEWLKVREWVVTQRQMRNALGDRFHEPLDSLMEAYADLLLIPLDEVVKRRVDECVEYVRLLGASRKPAVRERWPVVYRSLLDAITLSGDTEVPWATRQVTHSSRGP
jgi:hypothetical protein